MRYLLFVAASTSHATWLCLAFGCTSCDTLGRTLIVRKDVSGGILAIASSRSGTDAYCGIDPTYALARRVERSR